MVSKLESFHKGGGKKNMGKKAIQLIEFELI